MPIHNLGYRSWKGKVTSSLTRWWSISESGIRLAQQVPWVKRVVFAAWLPVLYWGMGFFVVGQALEGKISLDDRQPAIERRFRELKQHLPPQAKETASIANRHAVAHILRRQFQKMPKVEQLAKALESGDEVQARNRIWCWLLMTFFRYPQGILILFLIGTIAPALISRDIRSKAFLLYFSRPIGKLDYIVGKFCIPATFIVLVTTLPAMTLYLFGILMSPDLSVFWSTWDVPLRIAAGTAFLVLPTVALALMFSSLTQETRFASFGWFAFFTLGHGAWMAIAFSISLKKGLAMDPMLWEEPEVKRWGMLSLYNNIGEVQGWVFGFSKWSEVFPNVMVLAAITAGALLIMYRQISSPLRV